MTSVQTLRRRAYVSDYATASQLAAAASARNKLRKIRKRERKNRKQGRK